MRNMLQRGRIVLSWFLMGVMVLTFAGTNLLQHPLPFRYQPGFYLLAGKEMQKKSPEIRFPAGTAHCALWRIDCNRTSFLGRLV